ncbi:M14 family metallopeptidase [Micromonospora profundi]|uniref:M14 family metallopeptidase n=1 Tax=Micromonospora profundi TaxID=1420889 RepID=UPI0033B7335B
MTDGYFSDSYAEARERFRAAARGAGAELVSYRNDVAPGPGGEDLCTDTAWLGPRSATKVLFTVSGTHGVEGYTGSACQIALLGDLDANPLPPDTALVLVHALNPFGFAYNRRVNEDNVDLNRNFIAHDLPPGNDEYPRVHPALVPAEWVGAARVAADTELMAYAGAHGVRQLQAVVTAGQWSHPDGLFYGGTAPVWSHRLLREIATAFLPGRARVGYIDLHTGLGERGVGEPIFRGGRDADAFDRARSWYGPTVSRSEDGSSSSTRIVGNSATLIADVLTGGEELTAITLEFGTLPGIEVLEALRADNWLCLRAGVTPEPGAGVTPELRAAIKRQLRDAFYPPEAEWRETVLARGREVFAQAFAALAGHPIGVREPERA